MAGWQQTLGASGICPADSHWSYTSGPPASLRLRLSSVSRGDVWGAALTGGLPCCLPGSLPRPPQNSRITSDTSALLRNLRSQEALLGDKAQSPQA